MQKKRAFILLELLIALGLTATLLAVLFSFFASSVRMDLKIEKARACLYTHQHLHIRLSSLLTSIVPRSSIPPSAGPPLYTIQEKGTSLIAIFDNGIDPDPAFSGPIYGKIFLDDDANLCLGLWPLEKSNSYRKVILLNRVQELQFQFLVKKNLEQPDPKAISINSFLEWRTNLPKNCWEIPSLIRLKILQDGHELAFAFNLPFAEPVIYHEQEGRR